MSLTEANHMIRRLQLRVEELENELREKDHQIESLRSKLDMANDVLTLHTARSPGAEEGQGDQSIQGRARGVGISAEPTQQNYIVNMKLVKHDKESRQRELIERAISSNDYLNKLDKAQRVDLVECMAPRVVRKDQMIIQEGDVGNEMFVIEEGNVEVFKKSDLSFKPKAMRPAQLFGELAILYNCTRTASIKAVTDCKLWVIERKVFQSVMMKTTLSKQHNYMQALKNVPLFAPLSDDVLGKLADSVEERKFDGNDFIIRHGAHGNRCYVIYEGQCEIQFFDNRKPAQMLKKDQFFAVETLQDQDCTIENVVVPRDSSCFCLILAKETFNQVIAISRLPTADTAAPEAALVSKATSDEFGKVHLCAEDFEYVATLGVGGFGRVELVRYRHGSVLKTYAMKTLKKRHIVETRQQEHVMNEKNIMISCSSPFIVNLFGTFKDPKYLYMVFEACLGGELWTILRDYSHFDDGTTRFYTACVVEAFEYLHGKGIIYRDLKPENLLLDSHGYAKLCDFGFSKVIGNSKTWTFCGTPEYVPPEIILNRGHDYAADYWSLGILMFELLTGNPPFVGPDPMKTYNIILKGIDVIHFPSKKISRAANQLIRRLCKPSAAERLGAQKGGIKEIKKNKWFEGFNWDGIAKRRLQPPIMKSILSPVDVSNFDKYEKSSEVPPPDDFTAWAKDF